MTFIEIVIGGPILIIGLLAFSWLSLKLIQEISWLIFETFH